jgi:uncharacterized protein
MAGSEPEEVVRWPMIGQRWCDVSFLHWRYDPGVIQALLPDGLTVDTREGAGWIGLTPLAVEGSRPAMTPAVPGLSSFPETNLRTYVKGPDGRDGLWFFTLEADSLSTVTAASGLLGVPYRWASMAVRRHPDRITYDSRRRNRRNAIGHHIVVRPGDEPTADTTGLVAWLTGRWRAWTHVRRRFAAVPAQHEPWPVVDAELLELEENLLADAGLTPPANPPILHFAAGVHVRLGFPRLAGDGSLRGIAEPSAR